MSAPVGRPGPRAALAGSIEAAWYARRNGIPVLQPLAFVFGGIVRLRHWLWSSGLLQATRIGVPVVVIGNVSVGGTGKTPLTQWLVRALLARGAHPGVLMRGHGGSESGPLRVEPVHVPAEVGDEARLLADTLPVPVVVARQRAGGARLLESLGVDIVVCDDGLQHYALARDLEIVVVDAGRGFGNRALLPAGPLREPTSRVASADFLVVNGAADAGGAATAGIAPRRGPDGILAMTLAAADVLPLVAGSARTRALADFAGQRVHAVAAIGNPARFFAMLEAAGLVVARHPFADHHAFAPADLAFGDALPVLMTGKDAVKCVGFADARMWQVTLDTALAPAGGAALLDAVDALRARGAGSQ